MFRYPGGKNKLKNKILEKLNKHENLQYREPFFGGGSIGLNLDSKNIWINDKDIGIAYLWTAVIQHPYELIDLILNFTPSVSAFYEFKEELLQTTSVGNILDVGFKKLVVHQTSYSGLGTKSGGPQGGDKQESIYKIDCRWNPKGICKKIEKIHNKFKKINIYENCCTNLDFVDLIENNDCESLIYLDPPYYVKGNSLYQCGFTEQDHDRLAIALKNTKHKWVLSYDDCEEIRKLYNWANIDVLTVNYSITSSRTKYELLITKD